MDGWMDEFIYSDLSHQRDVQLSTTIYISHFVTSLYVIPFLQANLKPCLEASGGRLH
jgi:hypothetical protein